METRTAEIVERELKANGFKVRSGIAKTGVVGVLENGSGPIVMFRADMDCNRKSGGAHRRCRCRRVQTTIRSRPSALVKINLRWYDEKDRKLMLDAIEQINRSIAASYNMPESRYPTTVRKGWSTR